MVCDLLGSVFPKSAALRHEHIFLKVSSDLILDSGLYKWRITELFPGYADTSNTKPQEQQKHVLWREVTGDTWIKFHPTDTCGCQGEMETCLQGGMFTQAHRVSLLREAHIDLCLHFIFFSLLCSSSVLLEIGTCPNMSPPVMTRIAPLKTQEWREINCVWSSVKKLCTRTGRKAWRNLRKRDSRHSWKYKRKFKSNDVGDTQGAEN